MHTTSFFLKHSPGHVPAEDLRITPGARQDDHAQTREQTFCAALSMLQEVAANRSLMFTRYFSMRYGYGQREPRLLEPAGLKAFFPEENVQS